MRMIAKWMFCLAVIFLFINKSCEQNVKETLSISVKNDRYLECSTNSQHSSPQMTVLTQSPQNVTNVIGRFIEITNPGLILALCYTESFTDQKSQNNWITKMFRASKCKQHWLPSCQQVRKYFNIVEVISEEVFPLSSLKPQINHSIIEKKEGRHSISCSNSYPINQHQQLKLIRVLSNGKKLPVAMKVSNLSASFSENETFVQMSYHHEFIYGMEYLNNSFECGSEDIFSKAYQFQSSEKLMEEIKCEDHNMRIDYRSLYSKEFSQGIFYKEDYLVCSCSHSFPTPEIKWVNPMKQKIADHKLLYWKLKQMAEGVCCEIKQNLKNGRIHERKICPYTHDSIVSASSCKIIKKNWSSAKSSIYNLNIRGERMKLFCDMESNDQQWIVIQRRLNGTQPFDKSWIEYKNGFGDLNGEFWLGNEKLHQLTSAGSMKIRFDLWNKDDNHAFAEYSEFSVSGESDQYRLTISGCSGNAGDDMSYHSKMQFSTKDRDNDKRSWGSCSTVRGNGGWWYNNCANSNLNGEYFTPGKNSYNGPFWWNWKLNVDALKKITIKITYK